MRRFLLHSIFLTLFTGALCAQYPLNWAVTPGVTGMPAWTRENPGAASGTHMYVFGGRVLNSGSTATNALWEFDGSTWVERTANGAVGSPAARDQAGVCWDFGRGVLVVHGGRNQAGAVLNDTWEWDPNTNAWTEILIPGPPARRFTSIAWDPSGLSGDIVMYGGLDGTSTHLDDTWVYIGGAAWVQMTPTSVPPARRQHHLVTRADVGDVFLCAGQDASLPAPAKWRTDAWTWNGLDWTLIPTTNTPAAVVANQAVYDPNRGKIVMVGGNGINGGSPTSELSEFDNTTNDWTVHGYATPGTNDPVIGRISRYFAAFLPTTGYIYKVGGQNPSGTGAGLQTTCQYGLGLPQAYPGNGADAEIELSLNGTVSPGSGGVHGVAPSDSMSFRFRSPAGSLDNQGFVFAGNTFTTGSPFAGINLLPGDPINVWLNPATATIFLDGFAPSLFQPTLQPGGFDFGPFPVPAGLSGTGTSIMLQLVVSAPGFNPVNIGLSDGVELQLL